MKYTKRALALFLALCLTFTSVPLSVNATETVQGTAATGETVQDSTETIPGDETSETDSEGAETDGTGTTVEGESETEAGTTVDTSEENKDTTVDGGSEAETDNSSTALDTPEEANDKVAVASVTAGNTAENTPVFYASVEEDVAETAEDNIDYLFFATDRHADTDIIGKLLTNMESDIGDGALDYVGLGGDMVDNTDSYKSSTVLKEVTAVASNLDSSNVDLLYASHDKGCNDDVYIMNRSSGLWYTSDHAYVYGVIEDDVKSASSAQTAAENFVTWANGDDIDKSKTILVLSHFPIHAKRGDNAGAGYWHNALNTVATGSATGTEVVRNVAFFHGHNHTVDTTEYFHGVGETMSIESYVDASGVSVANAETIETYDSEIETYASASGTDATIYYTYATAGYLTEERGTGQAMLVAVTDDTVTFTKYKTSSEDQLGTVTRVTSSGEDTDVTLTNIAVTTMPAKTEYTVGESLDTTGMVVTATYSDGTTAAVTGYTLSEVDMTTTGTKTVTVTCEGATTTFEVTVSETSGEGEEGTTDSNLPAPTTARLEGEGGTTYKYTDTAATDGTGYILVSNGYALMNDNGSISAVAVTVSDDGKTITIADSVDVDTILWSIDSDGDVMNDGYYLLRQSGKSATAMTIGKNDSGEKYSDWSYSGTTLTVVGGSSSNTIYYAYYSIDNSAFYTYPSTSQTLKFYVPTTGTVEGTYSIAGNPEEVEQVVVNGTTTTLGSALTFTTDSGKVTTTDTTTTATYTVYSDPSGIISGISGNTVTFTGTYGTAYVKVSYTKTVNEKDYTVDNYITVTAKEPTYSIDITETLDETEVSVEDTIVIKGVEANDTYELNNVIYYEDATGKNEVGGEYINTSKLTWVSSNTKIATVDEDGTVTFTGAEGTVQITVLYEYADGKSVTDVVTFSVSKSQYVLPSDGTNDFPEYPNEGAIRYDKTATAVGNFSQTGIAQVELSMTGVPYTTDNAMDVVVMLDMTGSMSDNGMEAAEEATKAFVKTIVQNEDGSYNTNRVAVYAFNSGNSSPYELVSLKSITSDTELETANAAIDTASDKQASGGTPFNEAAEKCYNVLQTAKTDGTGNNRQQFCVFMSDGGPTSYAADDGDGTFTTVTNSGSGTTTITNYLSGYSSSTSTDWNFTLPSEYYTNLMKADGVTVYTVGLLLQTAPSNPSPYSSMTDSTYDSTTDSLTAIGSHYYFCSSILKQMATDESKYIDIFTVDNADNATAKFKAIASEILEAATDVVVQDKVADEYTMVFDIPTGTKDITGLNGQEFYIEVKEYTLDADHERTSTYTSLAKVYLGVNNGTYYAASDANETAYASPVFTAVEDGQKGYYSTVNSDYAAAEDEIVIKVDDTYYLFVADGTGTHNMTSGAYAYGTIDSTTNMSTDLVIVTPYFCYSAATRMLAWTAEKLTTTELALSYFLYLDESATEVGTDNEVDSATYPTNDYATITYTNYRGKECQQVFPIPQLTWNGAQVSYVFYLVNEYGQPVNRAGKVVPFAEAVYVTDVVTYAVTWNKDSSEGTESLDAAYLAEDLVPDVYALYDEAAEYEIHVYETNTNTAINDYFIIEGSDSGTINVGADLTVTNLETTKVFNTKAGDRYSTYGAYSATAGTYTDTDSTATYTVTEETAEEMAGFDFANTTVAFAVVWKPALVEDTVVVDYGLPVIIDVATNDALASGVVGVRKDAPASVTLNSGQYNAAKAASAALTHGTATVENLTSVRYELSDMTISDPEVFYYESDVNYYSYDNEGTATLNTTSMYSSVTVIPATTVYYEDSFVTYKDSTVAYNAEDETTGAVTCYGTWADDGTEDVATQATDRPGTSTITGLLDANNNYGYDAAYDNCTEYSMGSAKKVTVNTTTGAKGSNPSAEFTFNGTGFDLVSLTDNTSGMIKVTVKDFAGTTVKTMSVNNYYGYAYSEENGWVETNTGENALYQVPVIQITDLPQATYTVTVDVMYMSSMDSTGNGKYNFWLDAVRVYDPASADNKTVKAAYTADNELNPGYIELRDLLLAADDLDASTETVQDGAVFIDGMLNAEIADYEAYGPNNEVYLTKGQAVAFKMIANVEPQGIQIGAKLAQGTSADLYLNGSPFQTLNSATDRNYVLDNITWTWNGSGNYESNLIVFNNNSDNSIISLTNLKAINAVFVTSNSAAAASVMSLDLEDETAENTAAQISVVSSYALARTAVDIVNSIDKVVFVPESLEAFWSSLAVAGRKATLTIMTSEDVEAIDVDGTMITEYKTKKVYSGTFGDYTVSTKRVWTYTITAPEKGTYEYDVIAYDADGNESEPVTTTLNVKGSIWESLFPWLS